ncbi:hypothetical protein [Dielma fastidiosa]|uniref:hypothetical protein n=1 Tax=Dielma fastidiosa TaxID=1034346 RepID=UPI0023F16AC1|nr:hypothetical protein [Dielma fastidiosa]
MYKYIKPNNKLIPLIVVLVLCNVLLYANSQNQNRTIIAQQDLINQLEHTAQTAIADLADSNEHVRAYELRISQLEEELAYYQ